MPWYLNPLAMARTASGVREVWRGGGPARLRLLGVDAPRGWLLPSARFDLAIRARDGNEVELAPELPLPPLATLAYRAGRAAGVPIVADLDPSRLSLDIALPRLGR